ncbi:MAG: vWA domain-containing protein, partial [Planctomycetota bacterium]
MSFRVMHPQWIYAACFAVPFILLALRWFASMSLLRRWSAVLLRLVLFGLLALLLAGTSAVRTTDKFAVIFVVDVSKSMDRPINSIKGWESVSATQLAAPGTQHDLSPTKPVSALIRRFIDDTAARRGPDDMVGIVAFARQAAAVVSPTRSTDLEWSPDLPLGDATNIEDAIRLARAMLPPDAAGRIVLFSDGVQTTGDALAAASRLGAVNVGGQGRRDAEGGGGDGTGSRGAVPICVIPVEYDVRQEVYVESLDAPPHAAAGSTVSVRVVLVSTSATSGTLRLLDEQRPIDLNGSSPGDGRRVSLVPGQNVIVLDVPLPPGRIHRFRAIYESDVDPASPPDAPTLLGDTLTQNNVAEAFTITPGQGAILHLNAVNTGEGTTLSRTLVEAGFNVESVRPDALPSDLLTLQTYDLVIFENVGADGLSPDRQRLLLSYVKDLGGGLLIVGGPDAFGGGGWRGSELATVFPVELELPDRVVTPDSAIVFVIDNSGSMGFHVQGSVRSLQEIANESTALAIKSLEKNDLVGVISFNDGLAIRIPLAPNTNPEASAAIARSIHEGGGTVAGPALEEAANQLAPIQARSKHILLLSDGRSQGAESLAGLAARINARGITVSAISLGDIADRTTMQAIAVSGG